MNKISDAEIKNILRMRCEEIKEQIGEDRLFGIFVIGPALYGIAETTEQIRTIAGYIPTEDDLYFSIPQRKDFIHADGSVTLLTDLRCLLSLFKEQDINIMESIFSDYRIINPRYEEDYIKYILNNKEVIFKYEPYRRINNAITRGFVAIDKKNFVEAERIRFACEEYVNGTSIADCICLKKDFHLRYLESISKGEFEPDIKELKDDYMEILSKAKNMICNYEAETYFKDFIKIVITKANQDNIRVANILEFLTDKEKQALSIILSKLENGEGTISISKLLEESDISRPVFKSTLNKIEKYYIAEITNMGVKGTNIKLLTNIDI